MQYRTFPLALRAGGGAAHLCGDMTVVVGIVVRLVVAAMCAVRNGEGGMIGGSVGRLEGGR